MILFSKIWNGIHRRKCEKGSRKVKYSLASQKKYSILREPKYVYFLTSIFPRFLLHKTKRIYKWAIKLPPFRICLIMYGKRENMHVLANT